MAKTSRSFSIDEEIDELLVDRDDMNPSAAVNKFLREYTSSGQGEEAALAVRLEQLDAEISDLRKRLEQKERERERVQAALSERRSDLKEQLDHAEAKVRESKALQERLGPDNEAVQSWASTAGVTPNRFLTELQARL